MDSVQIEIQDSDNSILGVLEVGDVKNFPLALKSSISDLRDITIRSGSFSTPFKVPSTKENDKLFWCYFIIIHGEIAYQIQENKHILFEKNKKIDLVSKVRENKTILKQYKLTSLSELESNLSNDKYLSLVSFFSLMILEEKNVVYLKKKCFFKSFMNDSDTVYLISHNYGVCEITKAQFDELKEANLEINSLTKPIKSMTAYKLDDLKYICEKLSIQLGEKRNKKDLYEQIVQFFSHF